MFANQLDKQLSTLQRLLVIQLDGASDSATALLQQHRPDLVLVVLTVQDDDGSTVGYSLHGEVPLTVYDNCPQATIQWIEDQRVDAALVFAAREQSPYIWAYRCYLAGVPIRIGLSGEFGGQVLSHWIAPPDGDTSDPYLHLLEACGIIPSSVKQQVLTSSAP